MKEYYIPPEKSGFPVLLYKHHSGLRAMATDMRETGFEATAEDYLMIASTLEGLTSENENLKYHLENTRAELTDCINKIRGVKFRLVQITQVITDEQRK